jgi:trehalose 6-phosphate phosphatase
VPVPDVLGPLAAHPGSSAVFLDFDGTLSPIVADPAAARPLDGVAEVLATLGQRFAVVAVVSGRPGEFLAAHLGSPPGVRLVGLYGLEEVGAASGPTVDPGELARWRPVMEALAGRAERETPAGVAIERKTLGFTLHYRAAPEAEAWVLGFADGARDGDGVIAQRGRMAVELRPGIDVDKGAVVRALVGDCAAACGFGDDLGDLATFSALDDLARRGRHVVRVAVRDDETPAPLLEAADLIVEGPLGALELLRTLVA